MRTDARAAVQKVVFRTGGSGDVNYRTCGETAQMADEEHLRQIKEGVDAWNAWRRTKSQARIYGHPSRPDLGASILHLGDVAPNPVDLSHADLRRALLAEADLTEANLTEANLIEVNLRRAILLGHGLEMARGSKLRVIIRAGDLPFLSEAKDLAQQGFVTGASVRNWASYGRDVALPEHLPDWQRHLLTDPQTSGGLLVSCAPERAVAIAQGIVAAGYAGAAVVGHTEVEMHGARVEIV
jgi:Pentapeptide repeats (8 copies)/AIR synthase related protein, C-terminal domain